MRWAVGRDFANGRGAALRNTYSATSGSSAAYMFAYSIFYFHTQLEITKLTSTLLYFANDTKVEATGTVMLNLPSDVSRHRPAGID